MRYLKSRSLLVFLVLCNGLFTQVFGQESQMTMKAALDKIAVVYGSSFIYDDNLFDKEPPVKFQVPTNANRNIGEVLRDLLYPRGYLFLFVDKTHYTIVKEKEAARARNNNEPRSTSVPLQGNIPPSTRLVQGTVTDENGRPIVGATVVAEGTRLATQTTSYGTFQFFVPETAKTIAVSYVGAQTVSVTVPNTDSVRVVLNFGTATLTDVVVVSNGLQQLPKERATGSFSIVTAKQLEQTPTPNVLQRLETQVPGFQLNYLNGDNTIAYNSGPSLSRDAQTKTSVYTMSIRGIGTMNGDKYPLVVIDGFPAEIDIRTLNPNDIDQITVLKDAAAASIWGIRATNGVIVIQTKKGRLNQKPTISFNSNFGFAPKTNLNKQNLLTSAQMIDFEKELNDKNFVTDQSTADFGSGISQAQNLFFKAKRGEISQEQLSAALTQLGATTNYNEYGKYFLQAPTTQNYNLSVSGGSGNYTYFTSASYAKELTTDKGTSARRFTLTANQSFKIAKVIDFSSNLRLSTVNSKYNSIGMSALVNRSLPFMPYDHVVDAEGNGIGYYRTFNQTFSEKLLQRGYLDYRYNYLQEQQNMDNAINETNLTGNFSLTAPIPFIKGLQANVLYSVEKTFLNARDFSNINTFAARDFMNLATTYDAATGDITMNVPYGGILRTQANTRNNYSLRGQLSYSGKLGINHELNMIAGGEIRQTYDIMSPDLAYGWNDYSQTRPLVPTTYNSLWGYTMTLNMAEGYSDRKRRFLSYFSNAAYTFKGRYTLSASLRYDDYNNFGLDVKYRAKPFWSSGLSWNIRQESFMTNVNWLNDLKLRATYGLSGNIDRTAYPEATISSASSDYLTGLPYSTIVSPANELLRWETTRTLNLGIDFSLFQRRLTGSFEYYKRNGRDLFANFMTDPTYGFTTLNRNTATLDSKGFEGMFSGDIIRTPQFTWNATLTYAYNVNTVTDARYTVSPSIVNSPASAGPLKGFPSNYLLVYRFAGLDNTGQTLVYDQKNNKVAANQPLTDINDLKFAGTTLPKYFGAFSHSLRYRNWTLGAQLTYRLGYVFQRFSIPLYINRGIVAYSLNGDIAKRWRQAGDEATTNIPGLSNFTATSYQRYTYSDLNVLPGDYIRLQQVSLGYNLPDAWSNKLRMNNVSIQGIVRNLGLIWRKNKEGIDPDFQVGTTGSTLRLSPLPLYTLSINANF